MKLGGLLTSTFLNLVVVPADYAAIHGIALLERGRKTRGKPKT